MNERWKFWLSALLAFAVIGAAIFVPILRRRMKRAARLQQQSEEQARQIGEAWERLGDPKPQFNLEIHLPTGDKVFKVLGPHAPNLTANEVNLLHRLWLRFSDLVQPEELHHHDVGHFALEELRNELDAGKEVEVLNRLRVHLAANRNKKTTPPN